MTVAARTIRIGTRGSALALVQANAVAADLAGAGIAAEVVTIVTEGDRRAPDTAWGEGAFVSAIESALLDGTVDAAVHSAKDVPTDEDARLAIAAYLPRASPLDALVAPAGRRIASLADVPARSRVGTDSPRRTAFLRAIRPDLALHPLHGNVDTRLRRLDAGETDFLVLAEAGLARLGRDDRVGLRLDPGSVPPAPGQGALAIQVRADDEAAQRLIAGLDDRDTRMAVETERSLLAASGGGCRSPLGALAHVTGDVLDLLGGYARTDGRVVATATARGPVRDAGSLVGSLLDEIADRAAAAARALGAPRLLVTRPRHQSAAMSLALVDRGFAPIAVPAVEIAERDAADVAATLRRLQTFDWVVLTSANAVRALTAAVDRAGMSLATGDGGPRFAAVGRTTAAALRAAGIAVDFRPAAAASGAAVAESVPVEPGDRVLVPRGDLADETVAATLRRRGAMVETLTVYETREAPATSARLLADALEERPVAMVMTSGSTVRGFLALADRIGRRDSARAIPVIAIGAQTAAEADRHGLQVIATAAMQGPGGIADAAAAALDQTLEQS